MGGLAASGVALRASRGCSTWASSSGVRDELTERLRGRPRDDRRRAELQRRQTASTSSGCCSSRQVPLRTASPAPTSASRAAASGRCDPGSGLIGMLMGWWEVKLSSGCPLAGGRGRPRGRRLDPSIDRTGYPEPLCASCLRTGSRRGAGRADHVHRQSRAVDRARRCCGCGSARRSRARRRRSARRSARCSSA